MANQKGAASKKRLYLLLAFIGLLLIICSLSALAYAAWPVAGLQEQTPLAPTLFVPPG